MRSFEERPKGSWVVVFFPHSKDKEYTDIWLYPTMDMAMSVYSKFTRTRNVYSSAGEFANRHGAILLTKYIRDLIHQYSDPAQHYKTSDAYAGKELYSDIYEDTKDREILAQELWRLCQLAGDKVHKIGLQSVEDENMFKIRVDRMVTPEGREIWGKFPKQARQIVEALIVNAKSISPEDELQKMIASLVANRTLKTKQDPWRIFSYYAPMLGDSGFLYYPGKRHKIEDHNENV